MNPIILDLTEEERAMLIKHLEGLSELYNLVNTSGSGPLPELIAKIKRVPLPLRCSENTLNTLFRHINGASKYDEIAHGSSPLCSLVKKIERVTFGERIL